MPLAPRRRAIAESAHTAQERNMRIVVLIKEVPDTYGDRTLHPETGLTDRTVSERVLDEIGERAVEAALSFKDTDSSTEVVALTMGPDTAQAALRRALAMGADRAVHVCDSELAGADLTLTSEVLAAAARAVGFDLLLGGNLSTDGAGGILPTMLAELLELPHLTFLTSWELTPERVTGSRATEGGVVRVSSALPAVVSVTEAFPDGRFPSFKGIMASKKKPLETMTLADVGVSAAPEVPRSIMLAVAERPPRTAGTKVVDEGEGGVQLAKFLTENRLA